MPNEDNVRQAAEAIRGADALLIGAGAGMGVDSGLPDFRGPQGFWRAYPALAELGLAFEEIANPAWFRQDPALAWAFYGHRLNLYRATAPHPGFGQLLEIGRARPRGYFVYTSNVDGHFQRAGFAPERVVECHGSIHHFQCAGDCRGAIWEAESEVVEIEERTFRAREPLPRCRKCQGLARPNILMFGDPYWRDARSAEQRDRLDAWINGLERESARIVVVELGAGTAIPSVRYTCEAVAKRLRGQLVRINPREPDIPSGAISLPLGAAEAMRQIAALL